MLVPGGHVSPRKSADPALEQEFQHWRKGLRPGSPHHEQTVAELRELLLRATRHELGRRRHQLGSISGPELEDLAEQSANDAVLKIIAKLEDFRGASRFTTWAFKFAIFEVSGKVAQHAVAIALNEVSIDVLALELGANRNALYKNLFDARRKLPLALARAGHPLFTGDGA